MATETLVINAVPRAQRAAYVRQNREVPVVMYGNQMKSTSLSVNYKDFRNVFLKAGYSSLIDVQLEGSGQPVKAIIHDVQFHPVTDQIAHADFFAINMKEKITTFIPLKFTGSSTAVRTLGGMFITNKDKLHIRCLPGDLVHDLEVDISKLETFQDALKVKDIVVPAGIEVLDGAEDTIAHVEEQKEEMIDTAAPVAAVPTEIELSVKKGKSEEEGAEGGVKEEAKTQ